jgi:hypothetical protein
MSGIIAIAGRESWQVSGWSFQMVLDEAAALLPDPADKNAIDLALAVQCLDFKFLEAEQALRIARALLVVVERLRPRLIDHGTDPRDGELADLLLTLAASLRDAFELPGLR